MRNDADFHVRSPRGGRGSFFPSSFRTISNYLRSVSANASSIAASTVRQAAVSAASNGSLNEDDRHREQVQWANFDKLELGSGEIRQVLLLTYLNGFQVWDVEEASNVHELVSRRDGPVAFLRLQPKPIVQDAPDGGGGFKAARPLLLVVTGDAAGSGSPGAGGFPGGYGIGAVGSPLGVGGSHFVPTVVRFYSLRNHSYVHVLRFRTGIYAVRCSPRVVAVALATQIYCFDAATLLNIFSVLTYPSPTPSPGSSHSGYGAMAVGPRWLAYAANQPLMATTGRVSPQHLTPSPGVSPSTSPANGSLVAHYAMESSKHIVAGVVTLGDMGYKTISRYCSELMPDGGTGSPGLGSPSWKNGSNGHTPWQGAPSVEPEYAGTVIVRDFVSKSIVAQFRAHSSPLSALSFDPSGTLLVTASVYGHNLNVFRLTPPSSVSGDNAAGADGNTSYVHLYKLYRGVTNAVIQDISFSIDSQWIAVSSSRGTNHLFAISPFGGIVGPQTHAAIPVDGLIGPTLTPAPAFPWWSSTGPVRVNQQALPPPPPAINLNVVSRIKNGNGGWRGTVTSAAVAATGRPNALAGAVAAVFHDGGGAGVESDIGIGTLKDQLWVLCPTGHLLRYLLRPSAGGEGGYTNGLPQMAGMGTPGSPGGPQELKVVVEPVERWDVCRRPNWVEREERVESPGAYNDEGGPLVVSPGGSSGALAKEGMTTEEMQRWFMSNAEVQMHQARPVPIWAKSKIHFHVMLSGTPKESVGDDSLSGDGVGEMEIEKIPTRVVEVRRKDLVPVIERLQNFTKVQGARDIMVSDALPGVSGAHDQLLGEEGLQDGFMAGGLGGMPIQRTNSSSSFGSESAPFSGAAAGMNGFHRAYQVQAFKTWCNGLSQKVNKKREIAYSGGVIVFVPQFRYMSDLPEVAPTGTSPSSFEPSYFHQPQEGLEQPPAGRVGLSQGPLLSSKPCTSEFYQASFVSQPVSAEAGTIVIGSPPIDIPRLNRRDIGMFSGYAKQGFTAGFASTGRSMSRGADVNHDMLEGLRGGRGPLSSEASIAGQLGHPMAQIVATSADDESLTVPTREFEDLGVQENEGVQHLDSVAVANGKTSWDMLSTTKASHTQVVGNGSLPHGLHSVTVANGKTSWDMLPTTKASHTQVVGNGSLPHGLHSVVVANGKTSWDMLPTTKASHTQVVGNGSLPHGLHSGGSSTSKSTSNPEFDPAFLYDHDRHHGSSGVVSEGTLDGSPAHEDMNGTTEDAESVGAHSKSEDNEGVEQGDDVWEGAMFPFCEEDC